MDLARPVRSGRRSLVWAVGTVLVVDDEPDIRELVRFNLELDGHTVVTTGSGPEALEHMAAAPPDVIVLDVMLPEMDGWQVLAQMKGMADERVAHVPVIMLTSQRDDLDQIRGGIEGAIRYLTKPFSPSELRREVAAALTGEPEPVKRRRAQTDALEKLARIESGTVEPVPPGRRAPRPHLTRLERSPAPTVPRPAESRLSPDKVASLSDKQQELLRMVGSTPTVSEAAERLAVSRSNVYASLRRIARKLDVRSVPELVLLVRDGGVPT